MKNNQFKATERKANIGSTWHWVRLSNKFSRQSILALLSLMFLASCSSIPQIKISFEDDPAPHNVELSEEAKESSATKEPQVEHEELNSESPVVLNPEEPPEPATEQLSEPEIPTSIKPLPNATIPQDSPNELEPQTINQSSAGMTPQQLNRRVRQFTVRIDGAQNGSGVIVAQSDDTYAVLTNWHVVQNAEKYTISTADGRKHPVKYQEVRQLPGVDLALVKFNSKHNYQVAELGDSDYLSEGQSVHLAGYPGVKVNDERLYRFYNLNIVSLLDEPIDQGYAVLYEGETIAGMSGSPLIDGDGHLVGIHGIYRVDDPAIRKGSSYAVPINTYLELVAAKPAPENQIASQFSSDSSKANKQSAQGLGNLEEDSEDDVVANQEIQTLGEKIRDLEPEELESLPFEFRIFLQEDYRKYSSEKAIALALDPDGAYAWSVVSRKSFQLDANKEALSECEAKRQENQVEAECELYAVGLYRVIKKSH